jgi:ribosomal protein L7/L12
MANCIFCAHDNPPGLRRCRSCGAELAGSSSAVDRGGDDLESSVRSLLDKGEKIEAIRLFREQTAAGLKEAKDAVEAIGRGERYESRQDSRNSREEIRTLLERGHKIEAIKLYRERTGAGLKEAKEAVEAIQSGQAAPTGVQMDRDFEEEVVSLLARGEKIEAIRQYRKRNGLDLRTSKEAVEALAERRGIVISQGAGCLGVVVVVLVFFAAAVAFSNTSHIAIPSGVVGPSRFSDPRYLLGDGPCLRGALEDVALLGPLASGLVG